MNAKQDLQFEGFRLDRRNQQLRRGSRLISLRPKTFAVLEYFAQNPGRLITQPELLKAVWGPIAVAEGLLRWYIRDLRQALGDDAEHPRFIETAPRRGFRFLPKVTTDFDSVESISPIVSMTAPAAPGLIGRDQDLSSLHRLVDLARRGKRQVVFIAGEAGIGKTALLNTFVQQIASAAWVVCGQCVEQYGTREAYLPIFDALGRLCQGEHTTQALAILTQYAPSWLVQMPGLVSDDQLKALRNRVQGTTPTRMLGELCEALEALGSEQPFVLALEDLQWIDVSSLDLVSTLARRGHSARLLLIGTYRAADVIVSEHPLRAVLQDLQAHRQCTELWPDNLTEAEVEAYLTDRFTAHEFSPKLKQLIHRNTAGNPLFVTAIVDELVRDKLIDDGDGRWHLTADAEHLDTWRSASLRQLIEGQLARLSPGEQRLLEVAAIIGNEFRSNTVASGLEIDSLEVEEQADALVRRHQVLRKGGSVEEGAQAQYAFLHDLYRVAAFERSSQGRRRHWYKRIAEAIADHFVDRVEEVVTELAYYFEHAGMAAEAAEYCAIAGEKASKQFAYAEALSQFRRGIDLLKKTPGSNERDAIELRLQIGVAWPLVVQQGYRSEEVVAALARARELNEKLGEGPRSFSALRGFYELLAGRADYESTLALCDKMDQFAQGEKDPYFAAETLRLRGVCNFFLGRLNESRSELEESIAVYKRESGSSELLALSDAVSSFSVLSLALWMLGYPDQAIRWAGDALDRANVLGAPFSIVVARCFRAMLMRFLRDNAATITEAEAAMVTADKYGFPYWRAQASLEHGWATTMQGRGSTGVKEIRSVVNSVSLGLGGSMAKLAEACLKVGKNAEGLRAADEALAFVIEHKEGAWEPELHRLKGELLVQRAQARALKRGHDLEKAERCFTTAIERAQANSAKSFELRAAMSLHRLWSRAGKHAEAHRILNDVYGWFSEGFNSPDLVDARRLLDKR